MKNAKLIRLIGILGGAALLLVSIILYAGPFLNESTKIGNTTLVANLSGYELAFGTDIIKVQAGVLVGWILVLVLLLTSICLVVVDLFELVKVPFLGKKVVRLAVACCVLVLALVAGIMIFCTPSIVDVGMHIGASGVFAGLLTILGGAGVACGTALPALK